MQNENDFRQWHYLRPLLGSACPSNLLFVDTETSPIKDATNVAKEHHYLNFWCAEAMRYEDRKITRSQEATGVAQEDFWRFALSRTDNKRPLWIFAHNLGFDFTVLGFWQKVLDGDFEFQQNVAGTAKNVNKSDAKPWHGIAVLNDPPTILKFRLPGKKVTIVAVDTFNYFRMSLKAIGESIGMPKSDMPNQTASKDAWLAYCWNDVAILRQAVLALIDMVKQQKLGKFAYTISSQAMNAFRCQFMAPAKPLLIHGNRIAIKLERESYHGGMVWNWFLGRVVSTGGKHKSGYLPEPGTAAIAGPVHVFDVQSFYPSLMAKHLFPHKLTGVISSPTALQLANAADQYNGIARVALDCKPPGFPITRNGRTHYAAGKIITTLCGPELARAVREDAVYKCYGLATYGMTDLFSEFVSHFWKLREHYRRNNNPAFGYVAKLILNSLYGKFAQKAFRWVDATNVIPPIPFGYWWESKADTREAQLYRSLCWLPQKQCTASCDYHNCDGKECINPGHCKSNPLESQHSFPAVSSFVTAYGREEILRLVEIAGLQNCLYSDTDSLHVTDYGAMRLQAAGMVQAGVLGKLRTVETAYSAEYRGFKDYTLGGQLVQAGTKPDAVQHPDGSFEQQKFQRLASVLAGQELNAIAVERILVRREPYVPIGKVDQNGRVEVPLLNEW